MDDKSELKVGDLVRRAPYSADDAGMVTEIFLWGKSLAAHIKWFDTARGVGHWYLHQLEKVVKK